MSRKLIADYYPVFKDVSDIIRINPPEQRPEYNTCGSDQLPGQQIPYEESSEIPEMFNAQELADMAFEYGFSTFQTLIMLVKNAFEGHVYLTYHIRPHNLLNQGTILFKAKPEMMILDFYNHFARYKPGINQIWELIEAREEGLKEINVESLVHSIIVNHIIRFPVSIFSSCSIRTFNVTGTPNLHAVNHSFELILLGERILGEYEMTERVNFIYSTKFKEFSQQLKIKEEVISHYNKKLALALHSNIRTEEELDELMYKNLIEEKLSSTHQNLIRLDMAEIVNSETSQNLSGLKEKIKALYRYISKNCREVHTTADSENCFPELNHAFLESNSIYNESVTTPADVFLQYLKLLLLLSKVLIFRKTQGLTVSDCQQLVSESNGREVFISKDDLKSLRRSLDAKLALYRIRSCTDYKMKFVMDDDLTEIHKHFLQKQMDFVDKQILKIQNVIREVIKLKSHLSIFEANKN
jgi:hypothetical protein